MMSTNRWPKESFYKRTIQAVDIDQCLGEGEACRNQDDAPSFGKTVCRQKYTTYKMYVINEAGEQVYDTFSLPSACLCHHRSDFAIRHALLGKARSHLLVLVLYALFPTR